VKLAIGPYTELLETNLHSHALLFTIHFNIIFSICVNLPKVFQLNCVRISYNPTHTICPTILSFTDLTGFIFNEVYKLWRFLLLLFSIPVTSSPYNWRYLCEKGTSIFLPMDMFNFPTNQFNYFLLVSTLASPFLRLRPLSYLYKTRDTITILYTLTLDLHVKCRKIKDSESHSSKYLPHLICS
jgi:hypothetical protein